jgi:hypothetical protein
MIRNHEAVVVGDVDGCGCKNSPSIEDMIDGADRSIIDTK